MIKSSLIFVLIGFAIQTSYADTQFSAQIVSDYIARGISQTNNLPAIQGSIEETEVSKGLLFGLWSSNAYNIRNETEVDIYFKYTVNVTPDVRLNFSGLYFYYTKDQIYNTADYQIFLENSFLNLLISYRPDFFGSRTSNDYYELYQTFQIIPQKKISMIAALGYSRFGSELKSGMTNYLNYKITVVKSTDFFDFSLFYADTNRKIIINQEQSKAYDQNLGIALSKIF